MPNLKKVTTKTIRNFKGVKKITMLTAYDYPMAKIVDAAGCDMILVGDSLGNVVLGYDDTTHVTMADMLHHTKAVARGANRTLIVADMPFLSCRLGVYEAVKNAGLMLSEGNATAVKIEGGSDICDVISAITQAGIPVMGHLGLTPQSINQLGGYGIQGKTDEAAEKLIADACALEKAGAFSIVLECIPAELAKKVTESVSIPTIGIGSGKNCDGQVLVLYDILGLFKDYTPSFVKRYAELNDTVTNSVSNYIKDVEEGVFPK
ncbi:MAG: 3-methyl-2-oxobutanoate hydroxymethyltransferase [Oscillospiraceae bacterium]